MVALRPDLSRREYSPTPNEETEARWLCSPHDRSSGVAPDASPAAAPVTGFDGHVASSGLAAAAAAARAAALAAFALTRAL